MKQISIRSAVNAALFLLALSPAWSQVKVLTANTNVTGSINPQAGTINASGMYQAPASIAASQSEIVTASSVADTSKSGTPAVSLTVSAANLSTFAGNAQHTANYATPAQNLNRIHWSTSIDLNNSGALAHYGAPLVTSGNTVVVPVKTLGNGFQVSAFDGSTGAAKYTLPTNYILPTYNWIPSYSPALVTGVSGTRLYYPGAGGTIYYVTNPDSAPGVSTQQAFYGLSNYTANAAAFNSSVFINTPITGDTNGNVFFGFRAQGTAPAPLNTTQSGLRESNQRQCDYVLAGSAPGDTAIALTPTIRLRLKQRPEHPLRGGEIRDYRTKTPGAFCWISYLIFSSTIRECRGRRLRKSRYFCI